MCIEKYIMGTSVPSAAHLTVSLFLYSSEPAYASRLRALEGRCVSSKSRLRSETKTRELLEERKRIVFPQQGVIDLPYRKNNDFSSFWPPNV